MKIQVNKLLKHYKENLIDNPDLADQELLKKNLRDFVMLITKTVKAPSELDFLASMFKPVMAEFKAIIEKNFYANLSQKELANLCHLSIATFKRQFKKFYNKSPSKYISRMRISKAIIELRNREKRIADMVYGLEFQSLATFNRTFKKQTGESPLHYGMSLLE